MKKALLFLTSLFFISALTAQIKYVNYGEEGWVIPMNSNTPVDVDSDGTTDFFVNGYDNELGLVPIFYVGCISSPSAMAYVNFGAREMTRHEIGDLVQLNSANMNDYIDDDRGSAYKMGYGFAEGWADLEDEYIGFVIFPEGTGMVRHGWLKMAIDETDLTVVIKEMAFTDLQYEYNGSGINVGDQGTVAVNDLDEVLGQVSIAPNPADVQVQVSFEYSDSQPLAVTVFTKAGQAVFKNDNPVFNGSNSLKINTASWPAGTYFIHFKNADGVHTERLVIAR